MSHLVSVVVRHPVSIRKENVSVPRQEIIGSGFTGKVKGEVMEFFFTNDLTDRTDLVIDGQRVFDLDEPVDSHNWNTLKAYCMIHKDAAANIQLIDPQEETDRALAFSNKAFQVESYIRQNEDDLALLAKMYRRLIGLAAGLAPKTIFNALVSLSRTNPEAFLQGDKMLVENEDFEMLALLDVGIEKGVVLADTDGKIKKDRDTIYAKDIISAAFQLRTDSEYRVYLQRAVEGKLKTTPSGYEPIIEDSDYVKLASKVGVKAAEKIPVNDEFGISTANSGVSNAVSAEEIEQDLARFAQQGLLIKTGEKFSTRYVIPQISEQQFTRKEMISHLANNPAQYEHLRQMASVS
ncbi:hypothetical protein [Dyadobacter sp. BHUBP1]|uniref:hypothetical protein n=1 Tax=Dyadobacter sp. BHUBP1 TaxID=3424178 RepID=UPI003D336DBB